MALKEFSGGYCSLDMSVQPYADGPKIDRSLHEHIRDTVYANTDAPVTFKLSLNNGEYFNVEGENGVPPSVLALPKAWVDNFDISDDGRRRTVFVLKPGHAYLMHQADILEEQLKDLGLEEYERDN